MSDPLHYCAEAKKWILGAQYDLLGGFLRPGDMSPPEDWLIKVQAYCVLSHAALEELIELISKWAMEEIVTGFKFKKTYYPVLPVFCALDQNRKYVRETKKGAQDRNYDLVRNSLDAAKAFQTNYIQESNNGIDELHRRKLLVPVGLYLPPDMEELDALNKLIKNRHLGAHFGPDQEGVRSRQATVLPTPEDAVDIVDVAQRYFVRVAERAHDQYMPKIRHAKGQSRRLRFPIKRSAHGIKRSG
jgi:hypothetical protein